jgi:hypothetical protein
MLTLVDFVGDGNAHFGVAVIVSVGGETTFVKRAGDWVTV